MACQQYKWGASICVSMFNIYIASISHSDEKFIIRFCFGTCVWVKGNIQRNVKDVLRRNRMNEQMSCLITVLKS